MTTAMALGAIVISFAGLGRAAEKSTSVPAPAASPGQLIYAPQFSAADVWWTPRLGAGALKVESGRLDITSGAGQAAGTTNLKYLYRDADISVRMQALESGGSMKTFAMLAFAISKGGKDLYFVALRPDGSVRVARMVQAKITDLVPWEPAVVIREGFHEWNDLELTLRGNQGSLSINGTPVLQVPVDPPTGGGLIGLVVSAPPNASATWQFANLRVSAPRP